MPPPDVKSHRQQKKIESFFAPASSLTNKKPKVPLVRTKMDSSHAATPVAAEKISPKRKSLETVVDDSDTDVVKARRGTSSKRRAIQDDSDDDDEAELCGVPTAPAVTKNAMGIVDSSTDELVEEDDSKNEVNHETYGGASTKGEVSKATTRMSAPETKKKAVQDTRAPTKENAVLATAKKKGAVAAKSGKNTFVSKKAAPKASAKSGATTTKPSSEPKSDVAIAKDGVAGEDFDDEEEDASSPSNASKCVASKAASKSVFKSDEAVLKEIVSATWGDGEMPYSVLCHAFGQIEAVTSRLAIQDVMTTLFRQILLKPCPGDMSTVLYLASNSVAAAYECVELGIGDAILIKAIGQATGTNPTMVKARYETVGDLGSVAQSFKSKQSTLGGFFTVSKKSTKDYLAASEVLKTFRQIAVTKGSNSQKWKVDMIKKLLVHATDPAETKYIVRGLQGKLRIGLAQSTVLISLAHALALTSPKTVDIAAVKENVSGK